MRKKRPQSKNVGIQREKYHSYCHSCGCYETTLYMGNDEKIWKRHKGQLLNSVPDRGKQGGAQPSVYRRITHWYGETCAMIQTKGWFCSSYLRCRRTSRWNVDAYTHRLTYTLLNIHQPIYFMFCLTSIMSFEYLWKKTEMILDIFIALKGISMHRALQQETKESVTV